MTKNPQIINQSREFLRKHLKESVKGGAAVMTMTALAGVPVAIRADISTPSIMQVSTIKKGTEDDEDAGFSLAGLQQAAPTLMAMTLFDEATFNARVQAHNDNVDYFLDVLIPLYQSGNMSYEDLQSYFNDLQTEYNLLVEEYGYLVSEEGRSEELTAFEASESARHASESTAHSLSESERQNSESLVHSASESARYLSESLAHSLSESSVQSEIDSMNSSELARFQSESEAHSLSEQARYDSESTAFSLSESLVKSEIDSLNQSEEDRINSESTAHSISESNRYISESESYASEQLSLSNEADASNLSELERLASESVAHSISESNRYISESEAFASEQASLSDAVDASNLSESERVASEWTSFSLSELDRYNSESTAFSLAESTAMSTVDSLNASEAQRLIDEKSEFDSIEASLLDSENLSHSLSESLVASEIDSLNHSESVRMSELESDFDSLELARYLAESEAHSLSESARHSNELASHSTQESERYASVSTAHSLSESTRESLHDSVQDSLSESQAASENIVQSNSHAISESQRRSEEWASHSESEHSRYHSESEAHSITESERLVDESNAHSLAESTRRSQELSEHNSEQYSLYLSHSISESTRESEARATHSDSVAIRQSDIDSGYELSEKLAKITFLKTQHFLRDDFPTDPLLWGLTENEEYDAAWATYLGALDTDSNPTLWEETWLAWWKANVFPEMNRLAIRDFWVDVFTDDGFVSPTGFNYASYGYDPLLDLDGTVFESLGIVAAYEAAIAADLAQYALDSEAWLLAKAAYDEYQLKVAHYEAFIAGIDAYRLTLADEMARVGLLLQGAGGITDGEYWGTKIDGIDYDAAIPGDDPDIKGFGGIVFELWDVSRLGRLMNAAKAKKDADEAAMNLALADKNEKFEILQLALAALNGYLAGLEGEIDPTDPSYILLSAAYLIAYGNHETAITAYETAFETHEASLSAYNTAKAAHDKSIKRLSALMEAFEDAVTVYDTAFSTIETSLNAFINAEENPDLKEYGEGMALYMHDFAQYYKQQLGVMIYSQEYFDYLQDLQDWLDSNADNQAEADKIIWIDWLIDWGYLRDDFPSDPLYWTGMTDAEYVAAYEAFVKDYAIYRRDGGYDWAQYEADKLKYYTFIKSYMESLYLSELTEKANSMFGKTYAQLTELERAAVYDAMTQEQREVAYTHAMEDAETPGSESGFPFNPLLHDTYAGNPTHYKFACPGGHDIDFYVGRSTTVTKGNQLDGNASGATDLLDLGIILTNGEGSKPPSIRITYGAKAGLYEFYARDGGSVWYFTMYLTEENVAHLANGHPHEVVLSIPAFANGSQGIQANVSTMFTPFKLPFVEHVPMDWPDLPALEYDIDPPQRPTTDINLLQPDRPAVYPEVEDPGPAPIVPIEFKFEEGETPGADPMGEYTPGEKETFRVRPFRFRARRYRWQSFSFEELDFTFTKKPFNFKGKRFVFTSKPYVFNPGDFEKTAFEMKKLVFFPLAYKPGSRPFNYTSETFSGTSEGFSFSGYTSYSGSAKEYSGSAKEFSYSASDFYFTSGSFDSSSNSYSHSEGSFGFSDSDFDSSSQHFSHSPGEFKYKSTDFLHQSDSWSHTPGSHSFSASDFGGTSDSWSYEATDFVYSDSDFGFMATDFVFEPMTLEAAEYLMPLINEMPPPPTLDEEEELIEKTKWRDTDGNQLREDEDGLYPDDEGDDIPGYRFVSTETLTDEAGNITVINTYGLIPVEMPDYSGPTGSGTIPTDETLVTPTDETVVTAAMTEELPPMGELTDVLGPIGVGFLGLGGMLGWRRRKKKKVSADSEE